MNYLKKFTCIAVGIALIVGFSVSVRAAEWKGWNIHVEGYPNTVALDKFAELLDNKSGGKMKLKMYHAGTLGSQPDAIEQVRMGFARLDRSKCYTWREELICRSCYERCPLKATAIVLERAEYPVITDRCAGCGVCEHVCPQKAIITYPTRFAQ